MASQRMFNRMRLAPSPFASPSAPLYPSRSFHMSARRLADATPLPIRKPVGAFRGGMFGFLLGSVLAGAGVYYYVLEEYKVSNELLTEDIYTLQSSVQKVHSYITTLEEKISAMERKK